MYYYIFKAISKDGKSIRKYLYNESVDREFDEKAMIEFVKSFIKDEFKKENLNLKDFTFTRKLENYKDFSSNIDSYTFIDNTTPPKVEVPVDIKQSDESKEKYKEVCNSIKKRHARLPKNPYGTWAKDPNFRY